jgi:hypothetical protein
MQLLYFCIKFYKTAGAPGKNRTWAHGLGMKNNRGFRESQLRLVNKREGKILFHINYL